MDTTIRIGTRESSLATWQAKKVQSLLADQRIKSELVFIKSDGDQDTHTPLYEMGVQGIFTRSLDNALINNHIDLAVHSLKDVPTQLAAGLEVAAILKRGNYKDVFIVNEQYPKTLWQQREFNDAAAMFYKLLPQNLKEDNANNNIDTGDDILLNPRPAFTIATSSVRRKAQWLHRYPHDNFDILRGNVNTRLQKLEKSNWEGAIFAAAGLERLDLLPSSALELDWMLPAPAQGAIVVLCRSGHQLCLQAGALMHDKETALHTHIERSFLRGLMGGCSTPVGALALQDGKEIYFRGNIVSPDGKEKIEIERYIAVDKAETAGTKMAAELVLNGADKIISGTGK